MENKNYNPYDFERKLRDITKFQQREFTITAPITQYTKPEKPPTPLKALFIKAYNRFKTALR